MSKRQASLLSMGFVKKPKQTLLKVNTGRGAEDSNDAAPTSTRDVRSDQTGPSSIQLRLVNGNLQCYEQSMYVLSSQVVKYQSMS